MKKIRIVNTQEENISIARLICVYIRCNKEISIDYRTGKIELDGIELKPITQEDIVSVQNAYIKPGKYVDLEITDSEKLEYIPPRSIEVVTLPIYIFANRLVR